MRERIIIIALLIDIGLMLFVMHSQSAPEVTVPTQTMVMQKCVTVRSIDNKDVQVCSATDLEVTQMPTTSSKASYVGYQWSNPVR
jgi:hypothetical protein